MSDSRNKGLPLILTAGVIALDQISKALIVARVEPGTIGFSALGDFFWVVHERNPAIAFSIGYGLPPEVRSVLFVALPILLMRT